jgi:hypothetical protein
MNWRFCMHVIGFMYRKSRFYIHISNNIYSIFKLFQLYYCFLFFCEITRKRNVRWISGTYSFSFSFLLLFLFFLCHLFMLICFIFGRNLALFWPFKIFWLSMHYDCSSSHLFRCFRLLRLFFGPFLVIWFLLSFLVPLYLYLKLCS